MCDKSEITVRAGAGLDAPLGVEFCSLLFTRCFGGELGETMVTVGGDGEADREVVERGRCNDLPLGCRGRGKGGPGVLLRCMIGAESTGNQGEAPLGISSEVRVKTWTCC